MNRLLMFLVVILALGGTAAGVEYPTVNLPLPLVENSILPGAPVVLSVTVAPAGVPVLWGAQRAHGLPAASGARHQAV